MKLYRLSVTFIVLIAFASQMLHGDGLWLNTLQSAGWYKTEFCANKELHDNLITGHDISQTSEVSCSNTFNPIFALKLFVWEPTEINQHKEPIISYQNIQEQVFVDKLLEPPRV